MTQRIMRPGVLIPATFLLVMLSVGMYWHFAVVEEQPSNEITEFLGTFRTSTAPGALLGSYGRKRVEVSPHRFDRLGVPVWRGVGNVNLTSMRISTADTVRAREKLNAFHSLLDVLSRSELGARNQYELTIREIADLSLLMRAIADSAGVDPQLAEALGDPDVRIVLGVAEISDASETTHEDHQPAASAGAASGDTLSVEVQIIRNRERQIRNNTVVAYELGRLCWRKNTLAYIHKDIDGVSDDCPNGLHGRRGM